MTIRVGLSPRELEFLLDLIHDINPVDQQTNADITNITQASLLECDLLLDKYEPASYEFQRLMTIINKYSIKRSSK